MNVFLEEIIKSKYDFVTAAELDDDGMTLLFKRTEGKTSQEKVAFKPFMLLNNPVLLNGASLKYEIEKLEGNAPFAYLVYFPDAAAHDEACDFLKKTTGFNSAAPNAPYRVFSDFTTQMMIYSQFRLFRNMNFNDIVRFQFDIETSTTDGFEFPNPQRENDKVIIISMADSTGWEKVISMDNMTEKELLEDFIRTIQERDPDVIEGYNFFRFDIPFLEERAKRYKLKLSIGRNKTPLKKRNSRLSIAERTVNYTRYDAFGRHIVDIYHLVQFYDISHRDLESYGLKSVARHFGIAAENRTYIEGRDISSSWNSNRAELLKYALDDVRETKALSDLLSPSYFYQAQLIPMKYQDCVVRGNATRIDSMLVAEYVTEKKAVPLMESSRPFTGALTEAVSTGIFKNVWHCDVRSLYPSIILAEKWNPSRDSIGIFNSLLDKLRTFRLAAKDAEKKAGNRNEKDYYNALQTAFKILINSFYGYLGFSQGTFNDFDMADRVTAKGREILTTMLNFLRKSGANVIEMDTDGIYFQPPPSVSDDKKMQAMVQEILPPGIEVELDNKYKAMFCYKSKNYALLKEDGEISVTGAALKSRGIELFQREYIKTLIALLLSDKPNMINALTQDFKDKIRTRTFPLAQLAKTETLNDSPESYRKKMAAGEGRRSAAYELALKADKDYRQGDQISLYITGCKKNVSVVDNCRLLTDAPLERDENIEYYLAKIDELHKKFSEFIPPADDDNMLELR